MQTWCAVLELRRPGAVAGGSASAATSYPFACGKSRDSRRTLLTSPKEVTAVDSRIRRSVLPVVGLLSIALHIRTWWKTGWLV